MKQSLQLKMGQSLALTPQLQQAIKLLQLSTLDLQQAIEETLESNPLLEREEDVDALEGGQESQSDVDFTAQVSDPDSANELPVDTRWEDLMPSSAPPPSLPDGDMGQFADRDAEPETLHDQLHWQLNLTRFSATDHLIATAFIDAVDANGRLTQTPEEILEALRDPELELDEV